MVYVASANTGREYNNIIVLTDKQDVNKIEMQVCTYHIVGNFRGRKLLRIGKSDHFAEKTFVEY